jgi:hypothetical protein
MNPVVELLASQLHHEYRAAFKALHSGRGSFMGVGRVRSKSGTGCLNEHDHGWTKCHRQKYFLRRAAMLIKRGAVINPETLGEAECALAATVLIRRLSVEGKIRLSVETKRYYDAMVPISIELLTVAPELMIADDIIKHNHRRGKK